MKSSIFLLLLVLSSSAYANQTSIAVSYRFDSARPVKAISAEATLQASRHIPGCAKFVSNPLPAIIPSEKTVQVNVSQNEDLISISGKVVEGGLCNYKLSKVKLQVEVKTQNGKALLTPFVLDNATTYPNIANVNSERAATVRCKHEKEENKFMTCKADGTNSTGLGGAFLYYTSETDDLELTEIQVVIE